MRAIGLVYVNDWSINLVSEILIQELLKM